MSGPNGIATARARIAVLIHPRAAMFAVIATVAGGPNHARSAVGIRLCGAGAAHRVGALSELHCRVAATGLDLKLRSIAKGLLFGYLVV